MKGLCQASACLVSLLTFAVPLVCEQNPQSSLRNIEKNSQLIQVHPFPKEPFPRLRFVQPELTAALLLLGGEKPAPQGAVPPPPEAVLAAAVAQQLSAVHRQVPSLSVFFGFRPQPSPTAAAFGQTVLLVLPASEAVGAGEAARVVASAWLASTYRPAEPLPGISEPLLLLAESLAWLGNLALANTPVELLPLKQWRDPKTVAPILANLVEQALDSREPYHLRRARLRELLSPGRASPETAQAAAYLVEVFGEPEKARQEPFQLLQAWAAGKDPLYPRPPRALKRALAEPHQAGLPTKLESQEEASLASDQALRKAWASPTQAGPAEGAPQEALDIWYARRRALGLPTPPPRKLQPGQGYCLARPMNGHFAIYWRRGEEETLLLLWPTWVFSPQLVGEGEEVAFVDPQGVWRVSLEGGGAQRVVSGSFRQALISGEVVAALTWPGQQLMLFPSGKVVGLASCGFTWLSQDLLLLCHEEQLLLTNLQAEGEALMPFPCGTGVAGRGGQAWGLLGPPCEAALVLLDLGQRRLQPALKLSELPAELVPLPNGSLVLLTGQGTLSLEGEKVQRQGLAFSLGPG